MRYPPSTPLAGGLRTAPATQPAPTTPSVAPRPLALSAFAKALTTRRAERLARAADDQHTVPQAFAALFSELEITEAEQKKASTQQQSVRTKLRDRLEVEADYLSGSYRRRTQIRPLDDIDLLLVLDAEAYGVNEDSFDPDDAGSTSNVLDLVADAIRDAYPTTTEIVRHDRCIQIQFSGTGIGFDIVPAYRFTDDEFWIPDERLGRWIRTNPREVQRLVTARNQDDCGEWFVPLVKLLKAWKDQVEAPVGGFLLEAMAYHALTFTPKNEREGLAYLFEQLAIAIWDEVPDVWPDGEPASAGLTWSTRSQAATLLQRAGRDARKAIEAEEDGRTNEAHRIWRGLLGERYPESGEERQAQSTLSGNAALQAIRAGAYVSAGSAGLAAPSPSWAGTRSSTSHGGPVDGEALAYTPGAPDEGQRERLERQVAEARAQFAALERLSPEKAAADPALWPIREGEARRWYAVLVGEQRSNLTGRGHRILVAIPPDAPATEPRIYRLRQHVTQRLVGPGRFTPARPLKHQWADGAMCTHALRDGWDGRLVTLLVYAADWLVRQDYYQLTGHWIGREIGPKGLLVNERAPGARPGQTRSPVRGMTKSLRRGAATRGAR